ncbi:hypothetical protein [Streptomyces sp. H27-H5]|uniref:hypothetical protein n=1 Tax=Streptomyces sp. H27-H5 TaxID=2996460 RepID=UPI00227185C2|nr:hypothetical protein [Streptomyces sp. H27-H5]MCY0955828.1 hypothetical protein [Streptomyces sp. H27-H5]
MKDSSTDKVILNKAIKRVRFILGNSIVLITKDVALMDDGMVRVTCVRTPAYSRQAVVVTASLGRHDFRATVQRVREAEAEYITEELPLMVRDGKRWVPSTEGDFGPFTVALEIDECERPWFCVVDGYSLEDAYNTLTTLPFYREQMAGWEVESFPYLPEKSFAGLPTGLIYNDIRNEQYAGRQSVAA